MKGHWISVWQALLVLSIGLLVESVSQTRNCETFSGTTGLCLGNEDDSKFESDLKKWKSQRAETIKTLKDVKDKLDTICVGANYGKGAGNGEQLVGTVAAIVGSFMELVGLPSFKSAMEVGDLAYHSVSFVDGMSSIAESLGSTKYLNDAENILQKDKELSAPLGDWMLAWGFMGQIIQNTFGFDRLSEKWVQLANVLLEFSRIQSVTRDFKLTFEYMKIGKYSNYIATETSPDAFLRICSHMEHIPRLADGISLGLIGGNRVSAIDKTYQKSTGREFSEKMANIPHEYKNPTADSVAKYAFLRSIDVAVNFMSLLDVTKVIKEGKYKYVVSLKYIIDILELELKNMEDF